MSSFRKLYLASESERRISILTRLGVDFIALKPRVQELHKGDPYPIAVLNALSKARSVANRVRRGCIIAADTMVIVNGVVLDKPSNIDDARRMLKLLSGRWHRVLTGLTVLLVPEGLEFTAVEETKVRFKKLTEEEIEFYLSTGEPMGKAGGYAIQGYASLFIDRIEGCYFNVVGLPVRRLYKLLERAGVNLLDYVKVEREANVPPT